MSESVEVMTLHQTTGDRPLHEAKMTQFTDTYMRYQISMYVYSYGNVEVAIGMSIPNKASIPYDRFIQ